MVPQTTIVPYPIDSSIRRWMVFIDGEGVAIRGAELLKRWELHPCDGPFYWRDSLLWFPDFNHNQFLRAAGGATTPATALRSTYYTSVQGSSEDRARVEERIFELGLQGAVFQKPKGRESKGVDIQLARDLLVHAFERNFDACVLMAGDGDFVPLVEEVQRRGRVVIVAFFESQGLSPELRRAGDGFSSLDRVLLQHWEGHALEFVESRVFHGPGGQVTVKIHRRHVDGRSVLRFHPPSGGGENIRQLVLQEDESLDDPAALFERASTDSYWLYGAR